MVKNNEAAKAFQEVLKLSPSSPATLIRLADVQASLGNLPAAEEAAAQAFKNQPQDATIRLLFAKILLKRGKLKEADTQLATLVKSDPNSVHIRLALADLAWARGEVAKASEMYDFAFQHKPDSYEAIAGLTKTDLAQKKEAAARSRIEMQLQARPHDIELLNLGSAFFNTIGDFPRSISLLQQLIKADPSQLVAYQELGAIYLAQGQLDDAVKQYEQAARDPKAEVAAAATTMAGILLGLQGKPEEARKRYERAIALDPQAAVAANNLAFDYAETATNLDIALNLAQTAKARMPKSGEVSDTLGWIYYKKGLTTLAMTNLNEAAAQSPSNPIIQYHLGLAYLKSGDRAGARKSFQQALKLNPQFEAAEDTRRQLASLAG
jgi:tetratricopeptide (TPR) repeat protein